jgi:hypothetical protein
MDLGFARRSARTASIDLGSLLARASTEQLLSPTAAIQASAYRDERDAPPEQATLGVLLSTWVQRSAQGGASFNQEVAGSLISIRQSS